MHQPYDPSKLFDNMIEHLALRNDAELSRRLQVAPPLISKMRNCHLPVGGAVLIRMHEVTGLSLRALRALMGDRRQKFRLSHGHGRPKNCTG